MTKRGKKSISIGWLALLMLVACAAAFAVAYRYYVDGLDRETQPKRQSAAHSRAVVSPAPETYTVAVYLAAVENGRPYLRSVETRAGKDSRPGKLNQAMEALIAEGQKNDEGELIPKGTRLLSAVRVTGDVATVNLSREFLDNFPGGSTQENLTLNCIAFTIVGNSDGSVDKVRILVEGETAESLGGHYSLDEPIEPDPELLKP